MERVDVRPFIGHGVGLRVPHYARALERGLDVDWVEVVSENFMRPGGRPLAVLERLRRELPIVLHGVGLAVGSVAPLDRGYLARLRALADRVEPAWVSDHLCFGRVGPYHAHDLLPLPYTEEALALVVERVAAVQDALGRRILVENVSSYVGYVASAMPEHEFLAEVARRADCLILLDLNNVVVSAHNHGFAPAAYLAGLPGERIWQLHLANHDVRPDHRFDSHRGPVPDEVWSLFDDALARFGPISSLVEWDEDVPAWEVLRDEQRRAAARAAAVLTATAPATTPASATHPRALSTSTPPAPALDLAATQHLFWDVITHPTGARAYADARGAHAALAATFTGDGRFARLDRLEVYADAYFWRLHGVLGELVPLTARALGPARFHDLVTDYLLAAPSTSPDVGDLGAGLPAFVAARAEPDAAALAELAAVELAVADAVHGPDDAPATRADLAAVPLADWPSLRLAAVATARLVPSRIDVAAVKRAEISGTAPPPSPAGVILVWRRGHAAQLRAPDRAEAAALAALVAGTDFATVCAAARSPAEAAAWLARWLDDALVVIPG